MTELHQLVAIRGGVTSKAIETETTTFQRVGKPALFDGLTRTYRPLRDGDVVKPDESKRVQYTVKGTIEELVEAMTRLFDVTLTVESANVEAITDIEVDGQVLLPDVPVTYLMFLEKRLERINTFVEAIPTLDPAAKWDPSPTEDGQQETPETELMAVSKEPQPVVKWAPPGPEYKQEAQVEMFTKDVPVGTWTHKRFSGAISAKDKNAILRRVAKLREAVTFAREKANRLTVTDRQAGETLLGYIFD